MDQVIYVSFLETRLFAMGNAKSRITMTIPKMDNFESTEASISQNSLRKEKCRMATISK